MTLDNADEQDSNGNASGLRSKQLILRKAIREL